MAFEILVLDLHNTIYDEVLEYGQAIDAGVSEVINSGVYSEKDRSYIYEKIAEKHSELGSDWDDRVWDCLDVSDETKQAATNARENKSRELTKAFEGAVETISLLKNKGKKIYIVTEAAADAGAKAVKWLNLENIIDGLYTYPSHEKPEKLKGVFHKTFPVLDKEHIKKPNPCLLAEVALDEAKSAGKIPENIVFDDVFLLEHDTDFVLPEIPENAPIQNDITAKLVIKEGLYKDVLKQTLSSILYVGDSKFKDGFLARNSGVAFGLAAYGKKVKEEDRKAFEHSKKVMYQVTGWDSYTLKITQEAGLSEKVGDFKPDYLFEQSLEDALFLF